MNDLSKLDRANREIEAIEYLCLFLVAVCLLIVGAI